MFRGKVLKSVHQIWNLNFEQILKYYYKQPLYVGYWHVKSEDKELGPNMLVILHITEQF